MLESNGELSAAVLRVKSECVPSVSLADVFRTSEVVSSKYAYQAG